MARPKITEWFGKAPQQRHCAESFGSFKKRCFRTRREALRYARRLWKGRGRFESEWLGASPRVMVEVVDSTGVSVEAAEATTTRDAVRVARSICRGTGVTTGLDEHYVAEAAIAHVVDKTAPFYACAPAGDRVHKKWR